MNDFNESELKAVIMVTSAVYDFWKRKISFLQNQWTEPF